MPSSLSFASAPIRLLLRRRGDRCRGRVSHWPGTQTSAHAEREPWQAAHARVTMPSMESPPRPAQPVTPSPAATLVLLRDGAAHSVEALLLQRHGKSKFAGGDHVFAGGKVEAEDIPDDVERLCRGLTAQEAVSRLG